MQYNRIGFGRKLLEIAAVRTKYYSVFGCSNDCTNLIALLLDCPNDRKNKVFASLRDQSSVPMPNTISLLLTRSPLPLVDAEEFLADIAPGTAPLRNFMTGLQTATQLLEVLFEANLEGP